MCIIHKGLGELGDKLNEICFKHKITLEPLEPDEDEMTFGMGVWKSGGCGIRDGNLCILFNKEKFGQDQETALSQILKVLSSI
jgi:hypothetical protein